MVARRALVSRRGVPGGLANGVVVLYSLPLDRAEGRPSTGAARSARPGLEVLGQGPSVHSLTRRVPLSTQQQGRVVFLAPGDGGGPILDAAARAPAARIGVRGRRVKVKLAAAAKEKPELQTTRRKEGWLVFPCFHFFLEQGNCPVVRELPFPRY